MNFSIVKKAVLIAAMATSLTACMTTGPALKSSNSESIAGIEARLPYADYTSYFGYIDQGTTPQGTYKEKDAYYLYVWVPAVVDEIGVSMISPASGTPSDADFVSDAYTKLNANNPDKFFDTYIVLDRLDIVDSAKISKGGKSLQTLTYNDDSSELSANPSGSTYNSLLRHVSEVSSPTKALVRGVYRITFTSFRSTIEGSFEATVGTNVPGIKIAKSLDELQALVNKED